MQNLILIIGENLRINRAFLSYALSQYHSKMKDLADIKFINKNDINISSIIENYTRIYSTITIFASSENYYIIAKILATLNNDTLELKFENTLAPSMANLISEDSFLLRLNGCNINLLESDPLKKLPKILHIDSGEILNFYIFDEDIDEMSALLNDLGSKYAIKVTLSKFSKFLLKAEARVSEFGDSDGFIKDIKESLDSLIFEENFVEFIVNRLRLNSAKISFAESCTAGLIASKIGEIPGASDVFDGSLVTYSNEIKNIWLGVDSEILAEFGAVSRECVAGMLDGVCESSGANFALAVSGVAGPSGTQNLPVGTVIIGVKEQGGDVLVEEFHLEGSRNYIREESANIAFCMLLRLRGDLFFN